MANNGWNYNNGGYPYPPQQPPRRNNNNRRNQNYGGGWAQPQYPPQQRNDYRQPQYPPMQDEGPQYPFDIGQIVRHRYSGAELCVIRFGNEQIECRIPDTLRSEWFYPHELEPIDESAKKD